MNFFSIFGIFLLLTIGLGINSAHAQVDPIYDIIFFQTGELETEENKFSISSDFSIREFFNGDIIRVSGQTIEGFPYITYSKINNDKTDTFGKIFVNGKFIELVFGNEKITIEKIAENKKDDLSILIKYSQKVYSTNPAQFEIKVFDPIVNKLNDFNQNYGMIPNVNIKILVENNGEEIFYDELTGDDKGHVETEFIMPKDKISTYTVTITAENDDSLSSKIIQMINLGSKDNLK